ncbi:MAG: molecular chaperone HtpG, partial [Pirellulaceae bacterium]
FIPSSKPFDLYHPDRQTRVKLFIKRTFIAETGLELIPQYLRFLRGIIDSEDLPLNISRETIQNNPVLAKIKSSITKKVLSELRKKLEKDRADYLQFWNNFGGVLKEGLCDFLEGQQKDDILNACLFHSNLKNELITLKEYKDNLKDDQKEIFYLISDSLEKAKTSPQIEGFTAKGIEVLLLVDNVDQFWTNVVNEYGDLKLASVTKSSSDDFIENQNKNEDKDDTIN